MDEGSQFHPNRDNMEDNQTYSIAPMDSSSTSDSSEVEGKKRHWFWAYLGEKIEDIVNSFVPSDDLQQYHPSYFYPIAVVAMLLLLGTFLASFLPGYFEGISSRYLSPAADSDPDYCEPVPTTITGAFLGTRDGYWEGDDNFVYSNATYVMEGTNYQTTVVEYEKTMNGIYESLLEFGFYSKHLDLATNVLIWMTMVLTNGVNAAQRFYMFGDPLTIFNRNTIAGTISSVAGDCPVSTTTNFDPATGLLEMSYSITDYTANTVCVQAANPLNLGYSYVANSNYFKIKVDIRTLITALGVNLRTVKPSALQLIGDLPYSFTYQNETFAISTYIDPRYPGMQPITCANIYGTTLCTILLDQTYVVPVFRHVGQDYTFPVTCDCSTLTIEELSNPYGHCNLFQFLVGLIFYDTIDGIDALELVLKLGMQSVDAQSFPAMFVASPFGIQSPYRSYFDNTTYRAESLYSFCYTSSGRYCHFITFTLYDNHIPSYSVTKYFHQLPLGACHDSLSTSRENWNKLVVTPFTTLTQDYSICRDSIQTVFLAQFGNSMGNMSAATPVILFLLLIIMIMIQRLCGIQIPKKYSASEKQEILDQLAITLLIIRDGKVSPNELSTNIKRLRGKIIEQAAVEKKASMIEDDVEMAKKDDPIPSILAVPEGFQSSVLTLAQELALFDSLEYLQTYQYDTVQPETPLSSMAVVHPIPSTAASTTPAHQQLAVTTRRSSRYEPSPQPIDAFHSPATQGTSVSIDGIELASFYVDRSREQIKNERNPLSSTTTANNRHQSNYTRNSDDNMLMVTDDRGLIRNTMKMSMDNYIIDEYNPVNHVKAVTHSVAVDNVTYLNANVAPPTVNTDSNAGLLPTSLTAIRLDDTLFLQFRTWSNYLDRHIIILMEIYGNCPGVSWSMISTAYKYRKIYQSMKAKYENPDFLKDFHQLKLLEKATLQQYHVILLRMHQYPEEYHTFQIQYFEDIRSDLKKLLKKIMTLLMVHGSVQQGCEIGDVLRLHAQNIGYYIGGIPWTLAQLEQYVDLIMEK